MRVTISLANGQNLVFAEHVVEAGPAGTFFKVVTEHEEETTSGGLVARVGGVRKYTWVPASTVARVEVAE